MNSKDQGFQGRAGPGQMGRTGAPHEPEHIDVIHARDESAGQAPRHHAPGHVTTREELGDNRDGLGRDRTDAIDTDETGKLISAEKVIGTPVYNANSDRLGTVDSIMINKHSGRVAYAVMSFGGFLGIGERYHPLPWDMLTYDESKGGYNIDLTPEHLHRAPHYSREELSRLDYGRSGREIHDYYGTSASRTGETER